MEKTHQIIILLVLTVVACASENKKTTTTQTNEVKVEDKKIEKLVETAKTTPLNFQSATLKKTTFATTQGYHQTSDFTSTLTAENCEGFNAIIADLLDKTMYNKTITLRDYIQLKHNKDKTALKKIDVLETQFSPPDGSGKTRSFSISTNTFTYFFNYRYNSYSGERVQALEKMLNDKKCSPSDETK